MMDDAELSRILLYINFALSFIILSITVSLSLKLWKCSFRININLLCKIPARYENQTRFTQRKLEYGNATGRRGSIHVDSHFTLAVVVVVVVVVLTQKSRVSNFSISFHSRFLGNYAESRAAMPLRRKYGNKTSELNVIPREKTNPRVQFRCGNLSSHRNRKISSRRESLPRGI